MSNFDKLFQTINKVDNALNTANRVQYTFDRVEQTGRSVQNSQGSKWRWLIGVLVIAIAVLYFFFG